MKKNLLRNLMLLVTVLFTSSVFAQDWVSMMRDPNVNFYDVQKAFNSYYAKALAERAQDKKITGNAEEEEIPGYSQYKRWEYFMQPRVSPTGERFDPSMVWQEMSNYQKHYGTFGAGNWTSLGPNDVSAMVGAGRLNFITVDPSNSSSLWTGAPSGGLWHSTDGGASWTTKTDLTAQVIGYSDLAIDPTNSSTMYAATGDGDAGDSYSVGLLKSTDGGNTWSTTGLSFGMGAYRQINRVLVDPSNHLNVFVATTAGIYKSTDAGATFTQVQLGSFQSMEFKPGTSSTIYACGTTFYLSTNGGSGWGQVTSGVPASANVSRMKIGVTSASPTTVYLLAGGVQPNYGMQGFYKSTNSGTSFTTVATNISGFDATTPGQEWYDLTLTVSPSDANEIITGAQFLQGSTDGGVSWSGIGGSTHVDYHNAKYVSGSGGSGLVYVVSDGGIFKSTDGANSWSDLTNNLAISEIYGFGQSATNANVILTGHQDNGTNLYNGSGWSNVRGGDGTDCFVDQSNDQVMYAQMPPGSGGPNTTLLKSTNGGGSWSGILGSITEQGGWNTRWMQDPTTPGTIYAGFCNVWKSTSAGSWSKLGSITTNTITINALAVSKANTQVIWAANSVGLYKTSNGGTSCCLISGLPAGAIVDIACSPTDAQKAWVVYSGFSNKDKVYQTADQGATWTNLSGSIPNIPVNCITVDPSGTDALYIGTDVGAFYKDASMTVWQPFNNGLPNVSVRQLAIFPGSTKKIRCATYGRGVWESPLYQPGAYVPAANFAANNVVGCPGLGVQFTDYSAGQPTSWSWTFPNGSPATSTNQNPFVVYNTPGTYAVTLTATNANGNNTQTFTNYITVNASPHAAPTAAGKTFCGPAVVPLTATPSAVGTVRWWNQAAGGSVLATGNNYSPNVTGGTTTYYVDEAFPSGIQDIVGPQDNTLGAGAMFTANDIRGLYFDVMKPVIINTVDVYVNSAGARTFVINDANGNLVTDTTITLAANPSSPTTVHINRTVYPGTNYFMKFTGLVDCFRNTAGSSFPYTDGGSGAVQITGTNAGIAGYYYFFYNWTFTNIICNTARTAVTVTDTCNAQGVNDLFVNNHIDVYPNPNNGVFNVDFNTLNIDNYTIRVSNELGQVIYEQKLNEFSGTYSQKIDIASSKKGVYLLSVSNSKNQSVKKVIVY